MRAPDLRISIGRDPNHHRPPAVLAFWDGAFKVAVVQWVIFDFDGEAPVLGIEGRTFGDGSGFEHPFKF